MQAPPTTEHNIRTESHFPDLESKTLEGRPLRLPADLPGQRTVLILGFSREQRPTIEAWAKGMQRLGGENLPWLQLPVIDSPNAVVRAIVNGDMRHSIRRDIWPHIVALYTSKTVFERAVGIDNEKAVHVLVVDRSGNILDRASGTFAPDVGARLLATLHPSSGSGTE